MKFDYNEFTQRNLGFVTEEEQSILRNSCVFIPGVGGMGGVALGCLARSGVGKFIISDPDTFEVSNLNRQLFSSLEVMNKNKAEIAREAILKINPECEVEIASDWLNDLDNLLPRVNVIINGCDDVRATIALSRKCRQHSKTFVDAFGALFPNVYTMEPSEPRLEETLKAPTLNKDPKNFTDEEIKHFTFLELLYLLTHSSSSHFVIKKYAAEMIQGKRKRLSMAPMVWMTGVLMSYEATKVILGKSPLADHRGVFYNPYTFRVEKSSNFFTALIKRLMALIYLKKLSKF